MSDARKRLGRPPAIDSAETRQKILEAARHSFARRGYDATTNKDIAEEVGITTGAIYHYFASKADLYVAVYEEVQELVYETFEKAIVDSQTFAQRLEAALDAAVMVNQYDSSIAGFVVGVPDERARHEELRDRLAELQGRSRTFFKRMVDDAVQHGELCDEVSPQAVSDMITAITSGLARFSTMVDSTERHRLATDALKRLIEGSLLVSPRTQAATTAR